METKTVHVVNREKELADLLQEAKFFIWSVDVHSAQLDAYRDRLVERMERAINVQGKQLTVQR